MSIRVISAAEISQQDKFSSLVRENVLARSAATGKAPLYHILTFGCQQNENDSERMAGLLDQMGYQPAASAKEADLILLNTCSVRENADARFFGHLGLVKNIRRDKPGLLVGLAGCMMTQEDHVAKIRQSYPFVDLVFGPQDIYRLPELLFHRLTDTRRVYDVGEEDTLSEGQPIHRSRKHRALVSIMFGCNNFCTYCIVPYTRGRERSRSADDILGEIRQLVKEGYKEILLLGQNVNSYGLDLRRKAADLANESQDGQDQTDQGSNSQGLDGAECYDFADLIAQIAEIPNLYRIRFMTSHPKDISDKLLETISRYQNIEPHIHLPLQSGSDRILKKMNRHYTQAEFIEIARKARQLRPGLTLSTDLIVGFPGETEADFAETLKVMETIKFDAAFTFQYSRRSGTPAAEYPDQVDEQTVKERFGRLMDLQNTHSLASNQMIENTSQEILIEGRSENDPQVITGRTAHNRLVNVRIPDNVQFAPEFCESDGSLNAAKLEGQIARVFITRAKTFSVEGRWESLLPWA